MAFTPSNPLLSHLVHSCGGWCEAAELINAIAGGGAQNNMVAVTDPSIGNDSTQGYSIGSLWFNTITGSLFVAQDVTVGFAIWQFVSGSGFAGNSLIVVSSGVLTQVQSYDPTHDSFFWANPGTGEQAVIPNYGINAQGVSGAFFSDQTGTYYCMLGMPLQAALFSNGTNVATFCSTAFVLDMNGPVKYAALGGSGVAGAILSHDYVGDGSVSDMACGSSGNTLVSNGTVWASTTLNGAQLTMTDVTTNNVVSTKHGFAPKSPANAAQFLNGAATPAWASVTDANLSTSNITTNDVTSTKHGFAPVSPADALKFLNGGTTPAWTVPFATGKILNYNSVATAGWGVPATYGSGRSTGQTAAVASVATYTCGAADGSFDVSCNVNVTAVTTASFSVQVDYTDETNTARTLTLNTTSLAGVFITTITNVTGVGPYEGVANRIRCKSSTAITIKTTGTFTTVTYNVEGTITQVA